MGKVVLLHRGCNGDLPAKQVFDAAIDYGIKRVLIIGETAAGEKYYACSTGDSAWCGHNVQMFLHKFYNHEFDEDE